MSDAIASPFAADHQGFEAAANAPSPLSGQVIAWQRSRSRRTKESIFTRLYPSAFQSGMKFYRRFAPAMAARDYDAAASDVNMIIFRVARGYRPVGTFEAAIASAIRNQIADNLKASRRKKKSAGRPDVSIEDVHNLADGMAARALMIRREAESPVSERDRFNAWRRAAACLTAIQRHAVRARFFRELSYARIVASLDRFFPGPKPRRPKAAERAVANALRKLRGAEKNPFSGGNAIRCRSSASTEKNGVKLSKAHDDFNQKSRFWSQT